MVEKIFVNPPDHKEPPPPPYGETEISAYNPAFLPSSPETSSLPPSYTAPSANSPQAMETNPFYQSVSHYSPGENGRFYPSPLSDRPLGVSIAQPHHHHQHSPYLAVSPCAQAPLYLQHAPHESHSYNHHQQQSTHYQTIMISPREQATPLHGLCHTQTSPHDLIDESRRQFPVGAILFFLGWFLPPMWVVGACCYHCRRRHQHEARWGKANLIMTFVFILSVIVYSTTSITLRQWIELLRELIKLAIER